MELTVADFARFFKNKANGTYKCPFCSKEEFSMNIASDRIPGNPDAAMQVSMDLHVIFSYALPTASGMHSFYSFSCSNCGFTNFHHARQVSDWIADNPSPAPEEPKDG